MNVKVKKTLKDNKVSLIIIGILWVVLTIILVSPLAYSIANSINANGIFDFGVFIEELVANITSFNTFTKVFGEKYIGIFLKILAYYTIFYIIFATIGLFKTRAKSEYKDIEHGSSDWSEGGEEYQVLSKNKGILLAENHYLPVDKRGNINTLIVGRFWFW